MHQFIKIAKAFLLRAIIRRLWNVDRLASISVAAKKTTRRDLLPARPAGECGDVYGKNFVEDSEESCVKLCNTPAVAGLRLAQNFLTACVVLFARNFPVIRGSCDIDEFDLALKLVQYEADRIDLVPPVDYQYIDPFEDSDDIWRVIAHPEEEIQPENIINHDCMWAGDDAINPSNTFVPSDPITTPTTPGQSLLRRDMSPSRPDTPPSIDGDEPPQFRHTVDVAGTALRLLRNSAVVAADHSYTLSRRNMDNLGVQTPSDSGESEEEIDVVSLGTHQPLPSTETTHVYAESLSNASSASERQHIQRCVETITNPRSPRPIARKRLVPPPNIAGTSRRRPRGPGRRGRRSNTDTDSDAESPEIERRSIHNDMERLRRIGLKNLFDELKKQIPATRDKERAPKVVILREAASLCRKLSQEEAEREKLRKKQNQLITKLKKLRTMLSRYRTSAAARRQSEVYLLLIGRLVGRGASGPLGARRAAPAGCARAATGSAGRNIDSA
ncbi:unnamed protein product [Arctia plantaginis]|uniref:BHLH domain-containing protein n=1 Tax=Arctia plantaginis TaxID=874455 RepID=A0A8S1BN96_ARCPL|nr:unnamed protein product [Arctia plantaginis]